MTRRAAWAVWNVSSDSCSKRVPSTSVTLNMKETWFNSCPAARPWTAVKWKLIFNAWAWSWEPHDSQLCPEGVESSPLSLCRALSLCLRVSTYFTLPCRIICGVHVHFSKPGSNLSSILFPAASRAEAGPGWVLKKDIWDQMCTESDLSGRFKNLSDRFKNQAKLFKIKKENYLNLKLNWNTGWQGT